jgi:hypothetical protein
MVQPHALPVRGAMEGDAPEDQDDADALPPDVPPGSPPGDPLIPPDEEKEDDEDKYQMEAESEESKDLQDEDDQPEDPEQEGLGKYYSLRTWNGKAVSKMHVRFCNILQHNANTIVLLLEVFSLPIRLV